MIKIYESQYKGHQIKYNKDTDQYEVIVNGFVDAEFDTEDQARDWIANKEDTEAVDKFKSLFKNGRRLSPGQIDNYLSFDEYRKCDPDNVFIAKFKTKKDRVSGEALAKKNGFKVITRTDDDYGDSRTPYWTIFSI